MKTAQTKAKTQASNKLDLSNVLPNILKAHLESQNFHHAYLFVGPKSAGKYDAARLFTENLFRSTGWTPELLNFDFAETPNIENVRELIEASSLTSSQTGKRVIILQNFDLASAAAASSLLKTIEEPSSSSLLILIAHQAKVLPTIMSRCAVVRFNALSQNEIDEELSDQFKQFTEALKQGLAERLLLINSLSELSTSQLKSIVSAWLLKQKALLVDSTNALLNCRVASDTLLALNSNRNTKMVLQDFLLKTKI